MKNQKVAEHSTDQKEARLGAARTALQELAVKAEELALGLGYGNEDLTPEQKDLVRMAGFPIIRAALRDAEVMFLVGRGEEASSHVARVMSDWEF